MIKRLGALMAASLISGVAHAQETTTYTYDAKGRLVGVSHAGGPANGTVETITYDPADNRTNVTVTGATGTAGGGSGGGSGSASTDPGSGASVQSTRRFVVVPLNGYTLIYIN